MSAKSKKPLSENKNRIKLINLRLNAINFHVPGEFLYRLEEGDPWTFMAIYLHIFFDWNMNLSDKISQVLNPKLFEQKNTNKRQNDCNKKPIINTTCVNMLYTVLREIFNYKPKISPDKFLDRYLYTEDKLLMLMDVLNLCDKMVNRK